MKILVLNGSPKAKSDTMRLTESFLKGLTEKADTDIEIIDVIKKKVAPCFGCFGCWKAGNGKCIQKDDLNDILDSYVRADVILWSFPLYIYAMPSHLKAVLDRTIPLMKLKMKETNGRVHHESLVDLSKRRTIVISGAGFPDWEGNFDGLRRTCQLCFGNPTLIFVPETPLMNIPEAKPLTEPLLNAFLNAGREYAETGVLSEHTIQQLTTPMMPKEEYLSNVNASV